MPLFLTLVLHFLFALRVAAQGEDVVFAATTTPQAADDEETASGTSSEKPVATTASVTATIPPAENATVPITTTWPVATLFLPMSDPGNLAASIISTVRSSPAPNTSRMEERRGAKPEYQHPNYTAYALGCLAPSLRPSDAPDCNLSASLTLSEGVSTVIYTHSFQDECVSPKPPSPQTLDSPLHFSSKHLTSQKRPRPSNNLLPPARARRHPGALPHPRQQSRLHRPIRRRGLGLCADHDDAGQHADYVCRCDDHRRSGRMDGGAYAAK